MKSVIEKLHEQGFLTDDLLRIILTDRIDNYYRLTNPNLTDWNNKVEVTILYDGVFSIRLMGGSWNWSRDVENGSRTSSNGRYPFNFSSAGTPCKGFISEEEIDVLASYFLDRLSSKK